MIADSAAVACGLSGANSSTNNATGGAKQVRVQQYSRTFPLSTACAWFVPTG